MTAATLPSPGARRDVLRVVLLVVGLALLVRGPVLSNGFVNYDDPQVRAEVAAKGPIEIVSGTFYYAYKPVYGLALWLDGALFGDSPLGWHVLPWLLFAACAGLLVLLVHGWTKSLLFAAGVGAIFAVHPAHTESVAWVSGTKDALSLALVLLAHLAHRRSRARSAASIPWLAAVLFALGGLAKGTVWTWAGVVALDEATTNPRVAGGLRRLAPWILVALAGVGLDMWVGATAGPGSVAHDASTLGLLASMAGVHARYLASLLWPWGYSADYPVDPAGSFASPWSLVGLALAVLAVGGLVRGVSRRDPLLALGCGIWILGLLPVNNVWPKTSVLRADRYLVIPALGAYLLVAAALLRWRAARVAAFGAAVLLLAVLGWRQTSVWADSETLWTRAVDVEPRSAIAFVNRAADRAEAGRFSDAAEDAKRGTENAVALRRPELELRARLLRSTALLALPGRAGEALAEANAAVALAARIERTPWVRGDPSELQAAAQAALGQALETRARAAADPHAGAEDFAAAEAAYGRAVKLDPRSFAAWRNLGNLLVALRGEAGLARGSEALQKAVELAPNDAETVGFLVRVLYRQGKPDEAKRLYDATSRRLGSPRELRRVDARLTSEVGSPDEADRKLSALLADDPGDGETRALLAGLRRRRGTEWLAEARTTRDLEKAKLALASFDGAAKVWPRDVEALLGAGDSLLVLSRFGDARERFAAARAAAPDERWIRNLEARAGALTSAWLSHLGRPMDAAKAFAEVVRLAPPRVDLGYQALEAELLWLVPAAATVEGGAEGGPEVVLASACLEGAGLLVAGDEDGARATLARAAGAVGLAPDEATRLGKLFDACHLLLGIVKGRRADVAGARNELEPIASRRPGDPVVAYHLLLLDRIEAIARQRIAEGAGDAPGAAVAAAAGLEVGRKADALAKTNPPWPGPGLLASEVDIERQDFVSALQRLTVLGERFPDAASVWRGVAAIYQAQMLRGGDRVTLLGEAQRALDRAKALDPRDPRTALDLSQLHRLSGRLGAALAYAMSAASVEPIPGPASRVLSAILVEKGRQSLEARDVERALSLAASAAKADPSAPGPHLLEGDAWTSKQELDKALGAYRAARDKDPLGKDTLHSLAESHLLRGGVYFLWRQKYPRPREKDGVAPDPKALADWDDKNLKALRKARAEFESVLLVEPDHSQAEEVRQHISRLRAMDPEASAVDAAEARKAYEEGETLRRDGSALEALERYREATRRWPEHFPAWMRIAESSVNLGSAHDVEGLLAVDRLRELDPERQYPEPDLYAGEIWHRRFKADSRPETAARARKSLESFVASADGATARGAKNLARARALLADLPR